MNTIAPSDGYMRKSRVKYKSSVQPCHRRHNILPDTGRAWRWAKIRGSFYYSLANIPNRKPAFYRDMFGDADDLVSRYNRAMADSGRKMFASEFKTYVKANYKPYLPCYVEGCNGAQRTALAKACAAVEFAIRQMEDNDLSIGKLCQRVTEQIEDNDMRYLPRNYRRFQEKVDAVMGGTAAIAEVIRLPRANNNNALQYDDPQVLAWVMQLRAMGENYTNEHIIRRVKDACRISGKPVPCRRWFGTTILETHNTKFLTASGRFGEGSRRAQMYEGYVPMAGALYAGDCWQVDATRMQLIGHKADDGKKKFLYIVAVRDVHSGDLLGYSFDYSENRWAYRTALKMAVDNSGYIPYQLVVDRFPGHNTQEFKDIFHRMECMGVKVSITHKAQGKSHVERCFGTLQSVFQIEHPFYYGEGIKSTNATAHRSPDYINSAEKVARILKWDLTKAYNSCMEIVELYRDTKLSEYSRKHSEVRQSPKEIHRWGDKPHVTGVTAEQTLMLLGMHKSIRVSNNGRIITEIHKTEFIYNVADYGVISSVDQVVMAYDLEDLDKVELYGKKGQLLVHLCSAELFERPQVYGPNAEWGKVAKEQKRLREISERKADELEALTSAAGDETALLRGRFTIKQEAEEAETKQLSAPERMSRAVGSPYGNDDYENRLHAEPGDDDDDIDVDQYILGNY